MTAEEVLAGAADLLERNGWCQKRWGRESGEGEHCLLGAISASQGVIYTHWGTVKDALCKEIGIQEDGLIDWNNTPGRTAEEVITTLRNAKRWL